MDTHVIKAVTTQDREEIVELFNRYDLITLSFFLWAQKREVADSPKRRYIGFINAANKLLASCSFGELYPANPYECFIMLCLLTEVPLSTYADVWEMSYKEREKD